MIRVGCCGWCLGRSSYYRSFNAVELQDTFYDRPDPERLARLASEAPSEFSFAMKAWQAVTHPLDSPTWRRAKFRPPPELADRYGDLRTTKENLEAWDIVEKAARSLRARVVVVQTPPSFGYSDENARQAREFFVTVSPRDFVIGWEPRGTWRERPQEILRVIEDLDNVIHVVDPFKSEPVKEAKITYFRLHGIGKGEVNYRYKYTEDDLRKLCEIVRRRSDQSEVFVMFNNVYMKEDAQGFMRLCQTGP
ncbi:MAG: DUF72 domain-containing protein [Acidilobus sp.]